ncbi:N-acetylmuramoyl-L-alanine amidase [Virgibacillus sp. CBA3643]|uniref:N-acetylmuramoyl-L-alanine amidase n=1 Tax=Virgibacillus sp. CBA3643 TaxID=2942278 RepID=UPI0035A3C4B9
MTTKLYIDPGHGGSDPGAVDNGLLEKDIVLDIGLILRDILETEYEDAEVRMSRTGDTFPSLSDRTNDANDWGADYFVSIHINAGGGDGYEDYIYSGLSNSSSTANYQEVAHPHLVGANDMYDRGQKTANFHVLREAHASALLTENGFIDNADNAEKMELASWREDVAYGHAEAIADIFNLSKTGKEVSNDKPSGGATGETYTVKSGDTLWGIAQDYNLTVDKLKELNDLSSNIIQTGQELAVSESSGVTWVGTDLKGKRVESIYQGSDGLNFYDSARWTNPVDTFGYGMGWIVDNKYYVSDEGGEGYQFRVQNSNGDLYFITANDSFVKVI